MISFEFVAENFEELEADFQREYGIDLREALYGDDRMGARRLTALIRGLSPDSTTARRQYDGQEWSTLHEMVAALIESVDQLNRMFYVSNFDQKKNGKVWDPVHIPRPYERHRKQSSREEVRALFTNSGSLGVVVYDPSADPLHSSNGEVTE